MQSLPSIRLVQENDKGLVNKINSTIANTVPLWRQQLAQAITIFRAGQAAIGRQDVQIGDMGVLDAIPDAGVTQHELITR